MKRKMMILGILLAMVWLAGCTGKRSAILDTDKNGTITHNDTNISILQPSVSPVELARAYAIKKRADTEATALAGYKKGKVLKSTARYCFVATNLTNKPARVYHPELGSDFDLPANNGYQFLELSYIPKKIIFKNTKGKIIWSPSPNLRKIKTKKIFLGREVDLKLNLTSQ
ncbi:MAG: hypothetical protein U9R14_00070 [Patescibacteria group bacterium]|nr:hypothetical protein [Patescibacteria group bacterium]